MTCLLALCDFVCDGGETNGTIHAVCSLQPLESNLSLFCVIALHIFGEALSGWVKAGE